MNAQLNTYSQTVTEITLEGDSFRRMLSFRRRGTKIAGLEMECNGSRVSVTRQNILVQETTTRVETDGIIVEEWNVVMSAA